MLVHIAFSLSLQMSGLVSVDGFVTDEESGAPLHGARVEVTGSAFYVLTDSAGFYSLTVRPQGTRRLRILRLGYETQTLEVMPPALGTLRVDIALRAIPLIMPLVRVSALAPHTQDAGGAFAARNVHVRRMIPDHLDRYPVLAERDAFAVFAAEHDVALALESPNALHVRGGSSDQVRFLIDGVPLYNAAHSTGALGALNPDAVDAVALHTGARSAAFGSALAGTVDAQSRSADSVRFHARGGLSPTALRLTLDGPISPRSTVLLSARRGAPSLLAGKADRTRLTAAFSDWLFKSSTRVASGTLTLLATAANDRAGFSAHSESDRAQGPVDRHHFDWSGASVAALWTAALDSTRRFTASVWRAESDGDATWLQGEPLHMTSTRQTLGLRAAVARTDGDTEARFGADIELDRAAYKVLDEATGVVADPSLTSGSESSLAIFGDYSTSLSARWTMRSGLRAVLSSGALLAEPRAAASFRLTSSTSLSAGFARNYQRVQSLRNAESPAAMVFGADLPVLAQGAIPIGRSDEATISVDRLGRRTRLAVDGYARRLTGLVLGQPASATPFTLGPPTTGSGAVWGIGATLDSRWDRVTTRLVAAMSGARLTPRDSSRAPNIAAYQPAFASTRSLTAAAGYRVGTNTFLRSAVFARWGRRVTLFDGTLDWEGCDALDGGCEIAGTPGSATGLVSGARLPPYFRWDLGARRTWTASLAGRSVELEAHATLRNVLDRRNVWSFGASSAGQSPRALMLRPVSVLTAGVDFRY